MSWSALSGTGPLLVVVGGQRRPRPVRVTCDGKHGWRVSKTNGSLVAYVGPGYSEREAAETGLGGFTGRRRADGAWVACCRKDGAS